MSRATAPSSGSRADSSGSAQQFRSDGIGWAGLGSDLMLKDPLQQFIQIHIAGGNCKHHVSQFLLGIVQFDPIEGQEHQHAVDTDPFVAVKKGMVFNEPKAQPGGFLLHCRKQIPVPEGLKGSSNGRSQKTFVPDPISATCL